MTYYELLKRVYWALDEWIASSLGLGDYYGADDEVENEEEEEEEDENEAENDEEVTDNDEEVTDNDDEMADKDDGYDDMYKYHDHQA